MSPPPLSLYERIAVVTYQHSLSFSTFMSLSQWLGCYQYIYPTKRELIESALTLPLLSNKPGSILAQYHFCILLESCFTPTQQTNICRHIKCYMTHSTSPTQQPNLSLQPTMAPTQESLISPTLPSSRSIRVHANFNSRN